MKNYVRPNAELVLLDTADVIATSLVYGDNGFGDGTDYDSFING